MNIVGKTVSSIKYESQYEKLEVTFTDGTTLEVKQIGYEGEFRVTCEGEQILSDSQKEDEDSVRTWSYLVKKEAERNEVSYDLAERILRQRVSGQ
jgi:hypothetical protein